MAKFQSKPSLQEMQERLGFTEDSMALPDPSARRFYCDLKPVSDKTKQFLREYNELNKINQRPHRMAKTSLVLPDMGESVVIENEESMAIITRTNRVGLYKYSIDISYNSGFSLPLLFTEFEATSAIAAPKPLTTESVDNDSPFLKLPRELRENIYGFVIPRRELGIKDIDAFDSLYFPTAVGDASGFFFQLGNEPAILKVNRQIRQEALPLAYRNTTFCLDDLDDAVKLLVAAGHIGRSNITSLQFPWESKNDIEWSLEQSPYADYNEHILPSLHTLRCVQLLKECRMLQLLRICLGQDILENISAREFIADPGIASLCTLRGIRTIEVVDYTCESLEEHPIVKQLYEQISKENQQRAIQE